MSAGTRSKWISTTLAVACAYSVTALAQEAPDNSIGLNAAISPRYEGSRTYRTLPLPNVSLSHSIFFVRGLNAGIAYPLTPNLSVGLLVGVSPGRDDSDAPRLNGLGDIKTTAQYGAFVRWHAGPLSSDVRFLQAAHSGYGNRVTVGATYEVFDTPTDHVSLSTDSEWSNSPSMQTYFGLDSEQATNSVQHLPEYHPASGFSKVDVKTSWSHRLNEKWSVRTTVGVTTLLGDAADSPVVERRASVFGAVGVAYHF